MENRINSVTCHLDSTLGIAIVNDTGDVHENWGEVLTNAGKQYKVFASGLPVLKIETSQEIPDEPRVLGSLEMVFPSGKSFESAIGIELRGKTQLAFPKKSYRFECLDDSLLHKRDMTIPGLGVDDDWNLLSLYNEPLRFHSELAGSIWESMGRQAARIVFVDVFLNNHYVGIYGLTRRIDRKFLDLDHDGELYKGVSWGASTFDEVHDFDNDSVQWSGFEFLYPDQIDWAPLADWIGKLVEGNDSTFRDVVASSLDLENAADYFLFMNALRLRDNTGKNVYLARKSHSDPYYFVPWDLDGSWGNEYDASFRERTDDTLYNGLYERLLSQTNKELGFNLLLKKRWSELRKNVFSTSILKERLRESFENWNQSEMYARENSVWPGSVDTTRLMPTEYWIDQRIRFLDGFVDSLCP